MKVTLHGDYNPSPDDIAEEFWDSDAERQAEILLSLALICKNNYPQFCLQMYKVGENLSKEERYSISSCLRNILFEACSVWIGIEEAE